MDSIYQQNIIDEQAFNMQMSALRESASQTESVIDETVTDLETWESTLDGANCASRMKAPRGLKHLHGYDQQHIVCEGGLMLVNAWHSVPDYFSEDNLISVGNASGWDIPVTDSSIRLFP